MSVRTAWCDSAPRLAGWAFDRLAVRHDVWGGYWTDPEGKVRLMTKPWPKDLRGRVLLTPEVLQQHFAARHAGQLVGTHTTGPDNRCRWGGYDIDNHGAADPAQTWRWARALYDALAARGFWPLLYDSNGRGGYHCRVLLDDLTPAADLYHFLGAVARSVGFPGERFPKQASIPPDGCGNWMRLPGMFKDGSGYPRAWDGCRWIDADAVPRWLLAFGGDPARLVPPAPPAPPPRPTPAAAATAGTTATPARRRFVLRPSRGADAPTRIAAYLAKLPALDEGQGRDDVAYRAGAWLMHDMGLSESQALEWLRRWDSRNTTRKGGERLTVILGNVAKYGKRAGGKAQGEHHGTGKGD